MSKKDWQQLQAYRATGLTPGEVTVAVATAAMYTHGTLCRAEQKRLGMDFCPGKGLCPLGTAYVEAAAKDGKRTAAELGGCTDLAQRYPAVTIRALADEVDAWDEAHPEEAAK